ncbi:MAG: hypothetical protein QG671_3723 [Actinomycetota bacterium]|nr:hypothetical protein [Actinomycetota bacterium]
MKVLGTSVLVFEAIVVALFIPVAYFTGAATDGSTAAWLGGGLAIACLVGAGMVTRPGGIAVGWAIQVLVLACGFVVPLMFVLGGMFAALWWAAVRFGRKADAATRTREGGPTPLT